MSVLLLTVPKLNLTPAASENYGKEYQTIYKPLAELNTLRPWHTVEFTGKQLPDFFSAAATESAIRKIIADTSHAGGVRIRFLPGATYSNLIKALDIMTYTGQKNYWLAIRHQPLMLYAIATEQESRREKMLSAQLGCCTCGPYSLRPLSEPIWLALSRDLLQRPWRFTIFLLALLMGISCRQIFFARSS